MTNMRALMRIVEGAEQAVTPSESFMRELWDITDPHPFMRGQRLYGYSAVQAQPFIDNRANGITIQDILSLEAGQRKGHGRDALVMLCQLADKHNVTLSLHPKAYAKGPGSETFPKTKALQDWYARYGFKTRRGDAYWYRAPGTPIPAPRSATPVTEGAAETVTLLDLYEPSELMDTSEMLHNYAGGSIDWDKPLAVKTMTPDQAKTFRQAGSDMTVVAIFKKHAKKAQKALVKQKTDNYDHSRIIVVCHDAVVDGMHHLMAGILANEPIRYIDVAELD